MEKTGMRTFRIRTLESSNVMEYKRFPSKSISTASNNTACCDVDRSRISSFFICRNVLASPTRLPNPPWALVRATAAIVPFPWLGVNSQTNLYPFSKALLSVWFMLPRAVLAEELTVLEA